MGRSRAMGTRRRNRSTSPEAAEAKMASAAEGTRRRNHRSTKSEAKTKMALTSPEGDRILMPDSEEDRKILMKVKSEEGKILKLKKEYGEATQKALATVAHYLPPVPAEVKAAQQPAGKKTKKVLVKRLMTDAQIGFIKAMAAHPCPTSYPTDDELAMLPKCEQDRYRERINSLNKRDAYHKALVTLYERFGYAVDESEVEVTDDEGDDMVENY